MEVQVVFLFVLVVAHCVNDGVLSFNLEPKLPVIKRGEASSYFGFSVAQHTTSKGIPWMLVGAPLGQNFQPRTNRSGALFKCPISGLEDDCQQVITDGKRVLDSQVLSPPLHNELKDGQWLGVSVSSQGLGGKVLVCAHRYVHQGKDFRWGLGLCHSLNDDLEYDQTLEPCRNKQRHGLQDYGYCQAGTSADILDDNTALLGAPGAYTCRGTMYGISVSDDYLTKDRNHYHTALLERCPVEKYNYLGMAVTGGKFFGSSHSYVAGAPKAALGSGQVFFFSKLSEMIDLGDSLQGGDPTVLEVVASLTGEGFAHGFGSSLCALDLNGDKKLDLVVGAPFYSNEAGETGEGGAAYVYLNDNGFRENHPFVRLKGPAFSRFGVAISSAGDINKDGYDDLAVGAPYAFETVGAVYIFLGSENGVIKEPSQVIKGSDIYHSVRTFGYSLNGGMDLDNNSYPDLLVGAFESDEAILLRSRPVIDIKTNVVGELKNIDPSSPGCKAFPNGNRTCFSFQACFQLHGGSQIGTTSLDVEYKIEAETFKVGKRFSRVSFLDGNLDHPQIINRTVTMRRNSGSIRQCFHETVFLKNGTRDIQSPIAFKLAYTLIQRQPEFIRNVPRLPEIDNFPILNQQEASKVFLAYFEKDCGENELCESDLYVKATTNLEMDIDGNYLLILGQDNEFVLNVSVANLWEPAYEAMMFVKHPKSMSYIGLVQDSEKGFDCTPFNVSLVSCLLGNPYKETRRFDTIALRFDSGNLKDIETRLDFYIWSNSTSIETDEQNDNAKLVATAVKMAELSIRGRSEPEKVFYGGKVVGESAIKTFSEIGPRVVHKYEIWNAGPWKASSFNVDIWWPHQVENGKPQGKWLLYPEASPVVDGDGQCTVVNGVTDILNLRSKRETETVIASQQEKLVDGKYQTFVEMSCSRGTAKCFKIECVVRNLLPLESAVIKIHSRLWNATLVEDYPNVDQVRVRSGAKIKISEEIRQDPGNDVASVLTTCYPDLKLKIELEGIAWWIYALSILAGIIVLSLIIFCLYRSGFFKRRRPEPTHTANIHRPTKSL